MTPNERNLDDALAAWKSEAVPSSDLAGRIANAAVADFRFRKRVKIVTRVAGGTVAVMAIAFAVWFNGKSNERLDVASRPIINPFRETSNLFTSVSKTLTTEPPTMPTPEPLQFHTTAYRPMPETDRFMAIPVAARSGIEPVTEPATRAVSRFVKDFGSAFAIPKPKM